MRCWVNRVNHYSFVITLEMEDGPKFDKWVGYTASWKNTKFDLTPHGKQPANRIDGGPWKTFKEAEDACTNTYRQLRNKQ